MTVTPKFRLTLPTYDVPGWDASMNNNLSVIDAVLGQYTALLNVVGTWLNSTAYVINNQVIDPFDSSIWQCNVNHTSASSGLMSADRTAHPSYWTNVSAQATNAATSASAAAASATAASSSQTAAATSASSASSSATTATTASASASSSAVAAAVSAAAANTIGSFRNAVVNGGMDVVQRTTGPTWTVPANTATWSIDRWRAFHDGSGGTTQVTRVDQVPNNVPTINDLGLRYTLHYNVSGAASGQTLRQLVTQIEGVQTFAGRTVTLSFFAWCASGTVAMSAFFSQVFGTGGSTTVNSGATGFTISTTVAKYTCTVTLPSIAGKTIGTGNTDHLDVAFGLPLTGTYVVDITGVQLELGGAASNFTFRPVGVELELCQRYVQTGEIVSQGYALAGTVVSGGAGLHTTMRGAPTVNNVSSNANSNVSGGTLQSNTETAFYTATAVASTGYAIIVIYEVEAEIAP